MERARGLKKLFSLLLQRKSEIPGVQWAVRYLIVVKWFRYRLAFSKAAVFVTGLVFSFSLVNNGIFKTWMTEFTKEWKQTVPRAAAIINVKDAIAAVMVVGIAYITDAWINCCTMLLISIPPACIAGLILLYFSGWQVKLPRIWTSYLGLVLVTIGEPIRKPPLKSFFADQFNATGIDKDQVKARSEVWWAVFTFLGIIVTIFFDRIIGIITAISMVAAYFLFLCGMRFYFQETPAGDDCSTSMVFRVCLTAFLKGHLNYPDHISRLNYYREDDPKSVFPQTHNLRWLNKAAIIESSPHSSPEEVASIVINKWRLCSVKQVEQTKLLFGMLPMWMTFFVYGLVKSTGSTFFVEQWNNMESVVPIQSLFLIQFISEAMVSFLYEQMSKRLSEPKKRIATKVQMALGIASFAAACFVASWVEAERLSIVKKEGLMDKAHGTPLSMFFLIPQFCLLGVGKGLAEDGLLDFFYDQVPETFRSYGPPLNDCVIGMGNLLSIILVHVTRCFGDTLNKSRLDKYYMILSLLCSVNLVFYYYVSRRYKFDEATSQELAIIEYVPAATTT